MSKKWDDNKEQAKLDWRANVSKTTIQCDSNNLDQWLLLSLDDRISIALTIVDHLAQLSDEIAQDDRYIQMGTTQNKSNFVFALKGSGGPGCKFTEYDTSFVELLKKVALSLEELEYKQGSRSF